MPATILDLPDLLQGIPAGAWVAISEAQHKVMAYGIDAQAVLNESREKGELHPLITRVPDRPGSLFF